MKPRPHAPAVWSVAVLAMLLMAVSGSLPLRASGLQLCQTTDGERVYTDTACGALGARPLPVSAELRNRLAWESSSGVADITGLSDRRFGNAIAPRRSVQDGCAHSIGQLSADLLGAFAMGDVNRIAESFHWPGLHHQQAIGIMQQLQWLARHPLLDARYYALSSLMGWDPGDGQIQLTFDGRPQHVVDLAVTRYAGCYFVRF